MAQSHQSTHVAEAAEENAPGVEEDMWQIGDVRLERVAHKDSLTGPNDHFGCLLFDSSGALVKHAENKTWLYTGGLVDGQWNSFVREFDLASLRVGPRRLVLSPPKDKPKRWATIHLVVKAADDLFVAFYSTGGYVKAAVSRAPDGPFEVDQHFALTSSQEWEKGCSLESDGGLVAICDNERELRLWKLYDTLGPGTSGQNGWAEVRIDKQTRQVTMMRKHPQNPLPLLLPGHLAARTGGNLDAHVKLGGKHALFYLSKKDNRTYRMAVALSKDPLFCEVDANYELEGPLGDEAVIEKFQFFRHSEFLFVIYDTGHKNGDWRTGLRKYRVTSRAHR